MRLVLRRSVWVACAVLLQLLGPAGSVLGQSNSGLDPSQLLQNLSPEEQQAILSGMGQRGDQGTPADGERTGQPGERQPERRTRQKSFEQKKAELDQMAQLNPVFPMLQGEDWVVIEVDYFLPPRPISLQSLAAVGGVSNAQALQAIQGSNVAPAALAAGPAGMGQPTLGASGQTAAAQLAAGAAVVPGAGFAPGAAGMGLLGSGPQISIAGRKLNDDDRKHLQELIDLIRSRNPYRLSGDGTLNLPGFAPIPLLGLTEDQATLRLKVEPALRDLDIRITRLPLRRTGIEGLKPFGYDIFWGDTSTFAPVINVPVPANYVVGPGDQLSVQLFGSSNRTLHLTVGRDGRVALPNIGPVSVGGMLFTDAKAAIEDRVEKQMIGIRAEVSMRDTRSITVFVLGDVNTPGSYTISGLSTVTTALFAAGGIKPIGSMRRVELKRRGTLVRMLDLYNLLLHGNNAGDDQLQQGDVVFVPPVGPTVGVDGEVRRPAIYEIRDDSSVGAAVELAGGLTPQANPAAVITRIDASERRVVLPVNLESAESRAAHVRNGDLVRVDRLKPTLDSAVVVEGDVFAPGAFAYKQGIRITDVLRSVDQLRPGADMHYLLVRRETPPDRHISAVSADLAAALAAPGSPADIPLSPRDHIIVFDLTSSRDRVIQPLLDELRAQSDASRPPAVVHIEGRVRIPGEYPLETGMTVADLVRAGGGLSDNAFSGEAELTRYQIVDGTTRRTDISNVDLVQALRGDAAKNLVLRPFDDLSIKEVSLWTEQDTITLDGEVRFPGRYSIRKGETLKSVVQRAGGLTPYAFPEGSVFLREELKRREQEQIDLLITRTQADLANAGNVPTGATQIGTAATIAMGQSLLAQLKVAKPVGRLVIDLPRALKGPVGSPSDVLLRDKDQLLVPKFQQQVTVIGEVQNSTSHLYTPGTTRDAYIAMSGGTTRMADRARIYIVRANGSVVLGGSDHGWFRGHDDSSIRPGDTIVVPLDTEHLPSLPFWTAVTTILYNVAITLSAIRLL